MLRTSFATVRAMTIVMQNRKPSTTATSHEAKKHRDTEEVLQLIQPRPASAVSAWPPVVGRSPIAPGLFIYRFPANVFASGMHRFAGVALIVGFSGVMCGSAVAFPRGGDGFLRVVDGATRLPWVTRAAAKWCVGFPLIFHWAAGIRYLMWHWGLHGFDKARSTVVSTAMIGAAGVASVVLSVLRIRAPRL